MAAKRKVLLSVGHGGKQIFSYPKYDKYEVVIIPWKEGAQINKLLEDDNLGGILFTGGEDVHPMLYKQKNLKSYPNLHRDLMEKFLFEHCFEHGIPMIGICRGAQLMNVLMGGAMIQDINGHLGNSSHLIVTDDDKEIPVNSIHHQAMVPSNNMKVIARSKGDGIVETIVNAEHRMLGVQFHPEMMSPNAHGSIYFQSLIEKYDIL